MIAEFAFVYHLLVLAGIVLVALPLVWLSVWVGRMLWAFWSE